MIPSRRKLFQDGGDVASNLDLNFANVPAIPSNLSWSRNVTATVVDHEGLVKTAKVNEARFTGARRVENLVTYSQDFSNAYWTKTNVNLSTGITDPFNGTNAFTITASANDGGLTRSLTSLRIAGHTYAASYYIRRRTGTGRVDLYSSGSSTNVTALLTTSWKRIVINTNLTTIFSGVYLATSGDAIDIAYFLYEDVTGQANQNPSEYVSTGVLAYPYHGAGVDGVKYFNTTNGNTVTDNVVIEAAGTPLTGITLLCEGEARTNLCLQSEVFKTTWTNDNLVITDDSIVSPNGTTTADTITNNSTSGMHRLFQNIGASSSRSISVHAKAGTAEFIGLSLSGTGAEGAVFNLTTGAITNIGANVTAKIVPISLGWYRCILNPITGVGLFCVIGIGETASQAIPGTSYIGTGKSVYLWGAQGETAPTESSYIPTTTTAITRTADVPSFTNSLGSFSRNLPATVVDHEGLVKTAKANELRYTAGRRVENLLPASENFSAASWGTIISGTGTVTSTPNYGVAPDGTTTACRVQAARGTGGAFFVGTSAVNSNGRTSIVSVYIKSNTGLSQSVGLENKGSLNAHAPSVTVTSDWKRFQYRETTTATSGIIIGSDTTTDATVDILIWHPQEQNTTGNTSLVADEYVSTGVLSYPFHNSGVDGVKVFYSTNPNTVVNNVVIEGTGTPLLGVTPLIEESRGNLLLYSQAIVSGNWSIVSVTQAYVTAPDGTLTASQLTATAGGAYASQNFGTVSAGSSYTISVFVLATTGATVFPLISFNATGGTTQFNQYFLNTNLGTAQLRTGLTNVGSNPVILRVGNYWRISFLGTTVVGNTALSLYLYPAATTDLSTYSAVLTGVNTFWGMQLELGSTASSYIPTTTVAVTRPADVYVPPAYNLTSWYNPTQGTFVIKASGQYSSAPGNIGVWNPLLTGEGTYAIRYNRNQDNNAYLYLPNAQAGVNPLEYQDIPTPTTILLGEQGILNISRWTYYPKALKESKALALVNGTLTTAFDVSYAATTSLSNAFIGYPYKPNAKYFPKINTGTVTAMDGAWSVVNTLFQLPAFNFNSVLNASGAFYATRFSVFPEIKFPSLTTGTNLFNGNTLLTTFPPNVFNNSKCKTYGNAFSGCALTQTSVDNILVSIHQSVLNTPTLTGGTLNMIGGTNAAPSAVGIAAKDDLVNNYSWSVTHN